MSKFTLPTLETERLILRPLSIDDLNNVFKWAGDPRVNKYMIYPLYKSPEDGREWLENLYNVEKNIDYGFVYKETGELIGMGGVFCREENDGWVIGYNLRKEYWGQGLVPEAMKAIIDYVDKEKGIRMIYGEFAKENSKSKRVMEKLGMTYWKDCKYTKLDGSVTYDAYLYKREFP